jgi:hypothetical protein
MKRAISLSVLTISLLATMLLSAPSVGAGGFLHFEVTCPTEEEGQLLFPADQRLRLTDIILSASGETTFSLVFVPVGAEEAEVTLMKVFFRRIGGTVVSNFVGNVEGEDEFSLVAKCSAPDATTTTVAVTLVGSAGL